MGITPLFTPAEVHKIMQTSLQRLDKAIFNVLARLGENCANEARDFGSYQDQTSNLRSSVGYTVLIDGVPQIMDIRRSGTGTTDGTEGMEAARTLLTSLIPKYPKGYVLIVVAGKNYAAYVEARNYNVLSTAEHLAEAQLPRMIAELKARLS